MTALDALRHPQILSRAELRAAIADLLATGLLRALVPTFRPAMNARDSTEIRVDDGESTMAQCPRIAKCTPRKYGQASRRADSASATTESSR